jgi:antitoxin (DNA-binding transcriptional repressor) of toxin-antitoxin stability system
MKRSEVAGFPTVSIRELGKTPGMIVGRVERGERIIVCNRGFPVATIQPLTGFVTHPDGSIRDVAGSPLTDVAAAVTALPPHVKDALLSCSRDVIKLGPPISKWPVGTLAKAILELHARGLIRRQERGWVLTGLGHYFREELWKRRGSLD